MNSEETFVSRPGRRAHDPIMIKQFLCDYARTMKVLIVNMFNDADGCYDRIRHNIMAIAMQKRGCNKNVIEMVMAVLITMGHHVKCSTGVSEEFFTFTDLWRPAITYCTPVANLTKSQCDKIQSPFYQVLLSMMGFNRHMPRAVIFGPKRYGGRGIMDLYTETNIQHIDTITRHL